MRILVALDESQYARKAFETAVRLAKLEGAELHIVSVYPEFGAQDEITPRIADRFEREATKIVGDAQAAAGQAGLSPKTKVLSSVSPSESILDYAGENDVNLVVIGHRGKSNLERFLIGSVASSLVTYAPCSVLVVK